MFLCGFTVNFMNSRIEVFKQMLESDPHNTTIMFGLAKEYEKLSETNEVIALLENYLSKADDEGNAYGMLARAYEQNGDREKARSVYEKGIEVSLAHGHSSMANDYKMTLDLDYSD
jgi:predicted Zn-dependent protease